MSVVRRAASAELGGSLSHELSAFDERLENIAFVKDYLYRATTEEALPGRVFRSLDRDTHRLGAGDAVRFRIGQSVYLKASYEFATRLPRPDEVFGNGILVAPNLRLEPEQSHNGNFGPRVELRRTRFGDVTVNLNAFLRDTDRQNGLQNRISYRGRRGRARPDLPQAGQVFGELRSGSDRAGAMLAVGDSREQALERAAAAAERIGFVTADVEAHARRVGDDLPRLPAAGDRRGGDRGRRRDAALGLADDRAAGGGARGALRRVLEREARRSPSRRARRRCTSRSSRSASGPATR